MTLPKVAEVAAPSRAPVAAVTEPATSDEVHVGAEMLAAPVDGRPTSEKRSLAAPPPAPAPPPFSSS